MSSPILLSLAHFCDKHGPRVILVTQCGTSEDPLGENLLLPDFPTDTYCESCLIHLPEEGTNGVRSLRTVIGNVPYVTTQYSAIRFQLLTYIIKKAFSEETMVYDGTPLVFFDGLRGLNLIIGFKLYDENARGNERRYSFILTVDTVNEESAMQVISTHWNFILDGLNKMVEYIKVSHEKRLEEMQQRDNNWKTASDADFNAFSGTYLRANKSKMPVNLTTLTNDSLLFVRIHKWNTFLLSSINSTIKVPAA